jgi:glycosyltransferase involved in cell wall biosynthesis
MNDAPLVSIIIPCYNCELYVNEAVASIQNQTYKNIEIIITDDCSIDSTFSILQGIAKRDKRLKIFRNEKNLNIVKTLNNMLNIAKGKYIARMDADDVSLQERIERQVNFLENHSDYGMCGCSAWHINELGKKIGESLLPFSNNDIQYYKYFASPFYHPTIMIRAEIYLQERYNEDYLYAEDYDLWLRLLKRTKGENLHERLFCYRILKTSVSQKRNSRIIQQNLSNELQNLNRLDYVLKIKNVRAKSNLSLMLIKLRIAKLFCNPKLFIIILCMLFYLICIKIKWRIFYR